MFDDNQTEEDRLRAQIALIRMEGDRILADVELGNARTSARMAEYQLLHVKQLLQLAERKSPGRVPSDRMRKLLREIFDLIENPVPPIKTIEDCHQAIEIAEQRLQRK